MSVQIIYIAVWDDHDADIEVIPFLSEDLAVAWARSKILEVNSDPEDIDEELTESMRQAGWVYYGRYSLEDDSIRVMARPLHSSHTSTTG